MPPRYQYWTILIDQKPTAFRAQTREELLPTFYQLQRTNRDIVLKWFARGRVWESPAEARARPSPRPQRKWRDRETEHERSYRQSRPSGAKSGRVGQGDRRPRRAAVGRRKTERGG